MLVNHVSMQAVAGQGGRTLQECPEHIVDVHEAQALQGALLACHLICWLAEYRRTEDLVLGQGSKRCLDCHAVTNADYLQVLLPLEHVPNLRIHQQRPHAGGSHPVRARQQDQLEIEFFGQRPSSTSDEVQLVMLSLHYGDESMRAGTVLAPARKRDLCEACQG